MKNSKIILLLFFLIPVYIFANKIDSTKVYYSTISNSDTSYTYDTTLVNFHLSHPAFSKKYKFFVAPANVGQPIFLLEFSPLDSVGFKYSRNIGISYLFNSSSIQLLKTFKPFTLLEFNNTSLREQIFHVLHHRQLGKNLSLTLNYRLLHSAGFFLHQETSHNNFSSVIDYNPSNKIYGARFIYFYNRLLWSENGGINTSSQYKDDVFMKSAKNRFKSSGFLLTQRINFYKINPLDSLNKNLKCQLSHTFEYQRNSILYSDVAPFSIYSDTFMNSDTTLDSTYFSIVSNTFQLNNFESKSDIKLKIGAKHSYINFNDDLFASEFQQTISFIELKLAKHYKSIINANFQNIMNGLNQGDYKLCSTLGYRFSNNYDSLHTIYLNYSLLSAHPDYIYTHKYSNHFAWDKNLNAEEKSEISLNYIFRKFKTTVSFSNINNFTYSDSLVIPKQLNNAIQIIKFRIDKLFTVGPLNFDNSIVYQKSNSNIIQLPEILSRQALYFNFRLLTKHLLLQPGLEFLYVSAFTAQAYDPATQLFYNQQSFITNNFYHLDFFINASLDRARFYLKFQNITSLQNTDYVYIIPNQPIEPFIIKFGINWRLRD